MKDQAAASNIAHPSRQKCPRMIIRPAYVYCWQRARAIILHSSGYISTFILCTKQTKHITDFNLAFDSTSTCSHGAGSAEVFRGLSGPVFQLTCLDGRWYSGKGPCRFLYNDVLDSTYIQKRAANARARNTMDPRCTSAEVRPLKVGSKLDFVTSTVVPGTWKRKGVEKRSGAEKNWEGILMLFPGSELTWRNWGSK